MKQIGCGLGLRVSSCAINLRRGNKKNTLSLFQYKFSPLLFFLYFIVTNRISASTVVYTVWVLVKRYKECCF